MKKRNVILLAIFLIMFTVACAVVMFNKCSDVQIDHDIKPKQGIEINIDKDTVKIKNDSTSANH